MSVFSKIRNYISKHRGKFIVSSILITGSIFLTRYAQQKLKDWQEKEMLEFLERTKKQQYFENIGRTCNQTTVNLGFALMQALSQLIDTNKTVADLRTNTGNKVAVWETLKVQLFSKLCCLIYAITMLVVILRIQLSIIGGYLYKDSGAIPTDIQEKYLSLTQNLLNEGLNKLSSKITVVCEKVMNRIDLRKPMRLCDIDALFWSLQTAIEGIDENPINDMKTYLTLTSEENSSSKHIFISLLRDTLDFLESDEVKSLTMQLINIGFIQLSNQLADFFLSNGCTKEEFTTCPKGNSEDFIINKPLAKLLPIIHGKLSNNSFPEKFMEHLVANEKLLVFGANIYESYL